MQNTKIRKFTAFLLMLVMTASVFSAGAFADIWADDAVSSLTARFADDTVEAYPEIAELSTTVRLYKVAELADSGKVTPLAAYEGITGLGDIVRESDAEQVDAVLALLTAEFADKDIQEDYNFEISEKKGTIEGIENGVYLVLTDEFSSAEYVYNAAPMLLMFPWEVTVVNGESHYETDVDVYLKISRERALGDLKIIKIFLQVIKGDSPTCVFSVVGYFNGEMVIDTLVTFNFTAPGIKEYVIKDLPVGTEVTVTELYAGAGYGPAIKESETVTIVANTRLDGDDAADIDEDDIIPAVSVSFTNLPTGTFWGSTVRNVYSYQEGYGYKYEEQIFYTSAYAK